MSRLSACISGAGAGGNGRIIEKEQLYEAAAEMTE